MLKALWRVESSSWIAQTLMTILAVTLGGLGFGFLPPGVALVAGMALVLLIYYLRYKRV